MLNRHHLVCNCHNDDLHSGIDLGREATFIPDMIWEEVAFSEEGLKEGVIDDDAGW
jgi:hypothetical protein